MDVASLNFGKLELRPYAKVYSCSIFFFKEMLVYIERMVYTCLLNMKGNLYLYIPNFKNKIYIV